MTQALEITPPRQRLLEAAELLFAEKGLGAVSTREIAREAGQGNHSAVNYHFGSMDNLLQAILDYRMLPLNQRREELLQTLREQGSESSLEALLRVMIEPLAMELLRPARDSRYLRLMAQLMSNGEWQSLFLQHPHRSSALLETGELIMALLEPELGSEVALERLRLFGLHVLTTVTEWDAMARRGDLVLGPQDLAWRIDNLTNYFAAALCAAP